MAQKEKQRKKVETWFESMRVRAERGETPDMTMEEIIAGIALARAERHAKEATK